MADVMGAQVGEKKYDVGIKGVLQALIQRLETHASTLKPRKVDWDPYPVEGLNVAEEFTQDYLWHVSSTRGEPPVSEDVLTHSATGNGKILPPW